MATAKEKIEHDNKVNLASMAANAEHYLEQQIEAALHYASDLGEGIGNANLVFGATPKDFLDSFRRLAKILAVNPRTVIKKELQLVRELSRIALGNSHIQPPPHDLRFKHEIWQKNPYYRRVMQSFLIWRKTLFDILYSSNADPQDKERARFILMQLTEALAPTNTVIGNPGFVDSLVNTKGKSLIRGVQNFIDDMLHNHRMPRQVDTEAFQVGKNLATSKGSVVFRNAVCEVIQYEPQTEKVYARPVLIVPPQINKFYIVDLAPDKSFVKYAIDKGQQVFCISWRNPTAEHRDWDFDTYAEATLEAIDVVREISGEDSIDIMGACIGGATTTATLGYMAAVGELHKINTLTLLVTILDTSQPMLWSLFASEGAMQAAKRVIRQRGFVDGAEMGRVFAWMRPNDLVWLFFINNYLMGKKPPAFDILYWNNDTTRLPAEFHAQAMDLFMDNPLTQPGALKVLGQPVDVGKIDAPTYMLAGVKDHIVPWKAAYATTQLLGGEREFVLSASGHIQSVVNPPGKKKRWFYTNPDYIDDPHEWYERAEQHEGSWWDHWHDWILAHGDGRQIDAPRRLGSVTFPPGEAAPGRYVHE